MSNAFIDRTAKRIQIITNKDLKVVSDMSVCLSVCITKYKLQGQGG